MKIAIRRKNKQEDKPQYTVPQKPIRDWTISEVRDCCRSYRDNHKKCPNYTVDECGGEFCWARALLDWNCGI